MKSKPRIYYTAIYEIDEDEYNDIYDWHTDNYKDAYERLFAAVDCGKAIMISDGVSKTYGVIGQNNQKSE